MSDAAAPRVLSVSVVFARAEGYWATDLTLPAGATVADALRQLQNTLDYQQVQPEIAGLAIFGRVVGEDARLHEGDRLELLRALVADAKQARRARAVLPKRRS